MLFRSLFAVLLLAFFTTGTAAETAVALPQIAIPRIAPMTVTAQPPPAFRERAAAFGWLHHYRLGQTIQDNTAIQCAYDDEFLYFGWTANYSGRKPNGAQWGEDGPLWNEESVEIILGSGADQVHVIVNAYNSFYDEKNNDKRWKSATRHAASFDDHSWYGMAAVPRKELKFAPDGTIAVSVCRNIIAGQSDSSCWVAAGFQKTGILTLAEEAAVVTGFALPLRPVTGVNHGTVRFSRPAVPPETVQIELTVTQDGKSDVSRCQKELPAGAAELPFTFTVTNDGTHDYALTVTGQGGRVLFRNSGKMPVDPQLKITAKGEFYKGHLAVTVNATAVPECSPAGTAEILYDGKALVRKDFRLQDGMAALPLDTTTLKEAGEYQLQVSLSAAGGKTVSRKVPFLFAPRPAYVSKTAGTKTYYGKDWFPPKFVNGTVKVWGRDYVWKDTLFPASITSGGKELLAGAAYLEYQVNGKTVRLQQARLTPKATTPDRTVFTAVAEDANLRAEAEFSVEYDGHVGCDLQLISKVDAPITGLALVIPMTADSACYKLQNHEDWYSEERCRVATYPAAGKAFPFTHFAGLGTVDRALYFYSESSEGWLPYGRDNVERITRKGDAVEWRWTILDGQALNDLPVQRWGFMATPYRSLSPDDLTGFRELTIWPGGVFYPGEKPYRTDLIPYYKSQGVNVIHLHMNWCKHTGGHEPDDPERLKAFVKACHAEGIRVLLYLSTLLNEYEPGALYYGDAWLQRPGTAWFGRPWEPITKYRSVCRCPDAPDFVDWWLGGCEKLMKEYDVDGFYYDFGIGSCSNALHGCGFAGENAVIASTETTSTVGVNVEKLTEEDLKRWTTAPIRSNREIWRRMYNLVKEYKGEEGCIYGHTCDPARTFTFPFMDTTVHSEHAACHGYGEFRDLEKYRLYFSRQDQGTRGQVIPMQNSDPASHRRQLAITLLHREIPTLNTGHSGSLAGLSAPWVLKFRKLFCTFGVDNAEWLPYYANQDVVKIADATPLTNVSLWSKPDGALLVLSNLTDQDRTFRVTLSGKLRGFTQAADAEDPKGKAVIADDVLKVEVRKNDFRLIELGKAR